MNALLHSYQTFAQKCLTGIRLEYAKSLCANDELNSSSKCLSRAIAVTEGNKNGET